MNKVKDRSFKTALYVALLAALLLIAALIYLRWNNSPVTKPSKAQNNTQTTSKKPSQLTTPSNAQGGVTDQQGQTYSNLPPSSQWVSSSSGLITLQQPTSGSTLQTGESLVGLAKVSSIQFILTDNAVGLIDQGNLSVVNGRFSGILHFNSHSNTGNLQVYYPNPDNGAEEDVININVNFN